MKNFIITLLLNGLAVFLAAEFLPGVFVQGFFTAVVVALLLSFFSFFLKPILIVLTLPITVVTFGLFLLVIYVFVVYLCAWLIPGFIVSGFFSALLFSFFTSLLQAIFNSLR